MMKRGFSSGRTLATSVEHTLYCGHSTSPKKGVNMPYLIGAAVILVILFVIVWFRKQSKYYGRIFSLDHYAEIAEWAIQVIREHPVTAS
jgi:hypothetical protein